MIKRWRIRNRIVLLAMLPTILLAVALGTIFTKTRLADLDNLLLERGLATARQLASAAEYGVFNEHRNLLLSLANSALEERDIRSVALYDANQRVLAHSGPRLSQLDNLGELLTATITNRKLSDAIQVIVPIRLQQLMIDDLLDQPFDTRLPSGPDARPVGWVVLELSQAGTRLQKYQTYITMLALTLLGLLINWLVAMRMSRDVTQPIIQIAEAATAIKDGKLETRVFTQSSPELHLLESGINSMAESLSTAYEEMQQNVEQATEDLRETLETIEIQNIELDMARKEALEASRIKSEFLANMSHEIRTPLNGIIGFTNLLLKSNVNHQQRDHLKTIHKSSEILLTIINDILDFSKIEAGKLVLDRTPFRLWEIIEDVLTMLAPAAHQKNLDLTALVYSDVPKHITGDPLRIKQIITNLVNNGIKFTQSGEVVVRAMIEEQKGNQATVRISVSDTGVGLSRIQQQTLFTAFSQADASTARRFGGTGLGLVISKRLIEQMGGQIGLESELGKGSTFWFILPTEIAPTPSDAEEFAPLGGERIIYLENQPKTGLAVSHMIEEWGLELDRVESPSELLEQVALAQRDGRGYAVAIIGIHRHLLDSTQYKQLAKDLEFKKDCRVLLLTPTLDLGDKQLPLIASCSAHLTKPLSHDRLYHALRLLITGEIPAPKDLPLAIPAPTPKLALLPAPVDAPRLLSVDDNHANLKLIDAFLRDLGAESETATSGFEALSKVKQQPFDLVFMDVQMPGMDGIETTQKIRQLENGRHTPIIAVTAHALTEEKKHLMRSGFDDYLTKPIDEEQLIAVIVRKTGYQLVQRSHPPATHQTPERAPALKPSSRAVQGPCVDLENSVRLAGGKNGLAEELFCMLLDHLDDDYKAIGELARSGAHQELLERVHKLHGAARYCGVPVLRQLAGQLETELKQNIPDFQRSVDFLLNEIDRIRYWAEHNDWQDEFRNYEASTANAKT